MKIANLISVQQFCIHYKVPVEFINELKEYELIEIVVTENENYLKITQLHKVEKMMRLHYDLEINLEGVDVIYNLLQQIEILQKENKMLHNKLKNLED